MTSTKKLRYAGFILLAVSALLLLYFCSVSIRNRHEAAADHYAVLIITQDADVFPAADYDVLFSNLGLSSFHYPLDAADSADDAAAGITAAIDATGSGHVILLACGDAAMPVLHASIGQSKAAAVILLAPTLRQTDSLEAFGTANPSVRTAVFSASSAYSGALYERLSGEDTTLFPGLESNGWISSTAFISPDTSRYLESWNLTGHESLDRALLTALPDSQVRVGEYINNYVLPDGMRSEANLNQADALYQVLKIMAYAGLISGLLFFFASIHKALRKESLPADAALPLAREKNDAEAYALRRAAARSLLLSGVFGVLVTAAVLILYAAGRQTAFAVLYGWPVLFFAADTFIHSRSITKTALFAGVPARRLALSGSLMLFFLLGCGSMRYMYFAGLPRENSLPAFLLAAIIVLLLFLFVWMSDTAGNRAKTIKDSRLDAFVFSRTIILFIPFAAMIIIRAAKDGMLKAALSAAVTILLFLCLRVKGIFRRISGADWGGAAVFSVLYAIAVII